MVCLTGSGNLTRILTPRNTLNATAYDEYSPLYLPIRFVLNGAFLKVGFRPGISCSRGSPAFVPPTNSSDSCAQSPRSSLRLSSFGPTRQFHPTLYATILGALIPVPFWLWVRWLGSPASKIYAPAWFANKPPATVINASSSFVVDLVFQYIIRKKKILFSSGGPSSATSRVRD